MKPEQIWTHKDIRLLLSKRRPVVGHAQLEAWEPTVFWNPGQLWHKESWMVLPVWRKISAPAAAQWPDGCSGPAIWNGLLY